VYLWLLKGFLFFGVYKGGDLGPLPHHEKEFFSTKKGGGNDRNLFRRPTRVRLNRSGSREAEPIEESSEG